MRLYQLLELQNERMSLVSYHEHTLDTIFLQSGIQLIVLRSDSDTIFLPHLHLAIASVFDSIIGTPVTGAALVLLVMSRISSGSPSVAIG